MKIATTTLLAAALAAVAAVVAPTAHAQAHGGDAGDMLALLREEMAQLEQFYDAAFGDSTDDDDASMETPIAKPLTQEEKTLACRVGVQRVAEQALLAQETQRLRLRTSGLVEVHFVDEASCDALPSKAMQRECERVAAMDEDIEAFLREGRSVEEICEVVQEIEAFEDDPTPLSCKLCKRFVAMVDQAIAQDMQQVQQVREILGDLCDSMSADSMCHTFLNQYDQVVKWLKDGSSPEFVCATLTMCTATQKPQKNLLLKPKAVVAPAKKAVATVSASASVQDKNECVYCQHVTTVVGFVLRHAPSHIDFVRTLIDMGCKLVPSGVCAIAEKNFDQIVSLTKQGKSPKEVCEAVGMCSNTLLLDASTSKALALLTKPLTTIKIAELFIAATPLDDKKCFYCDYAVTLIEVALQEDPSDLDAVRTYADIVCGMLGETSKCHQYVDKFDFVVQALQKGEKPRAICAELKFCTAKATKALPQPQKASTSSAMSVVMPAVHGLDNCFFCTQVATLFQIVMAQDPSQVDNIRMVADLVCKALPEDNQCHKVMQQIDEVIDSIKKGEKPEAICHDLKFCPAKEESSALVVATSPMDDKKCFYCDYFATLLEVALQEDPTDLEQIRQYADIVCSMLGDSNVCHQYIDKFDYAVDELQKGKKPREICTALKFCTAKALPVAEDTSALLAHTMSQSVVMPKAGGMDNCFFCTQVASLMEVAYAQDPSQIDQIRMVADLICKALPKENKCHEVVKEFDQIVDSIKKGEKPAAICHDLKFCPTASFNLALPKAVPNVKANYCGYCDGVTTVLEYAIKLKPEQVQQAREAAGIVCDFLPQDDQCHDDLKMFDKAVAELKAGKSPHDICTELKFCNSTLALPSSKLMPLSAAKLDMMNAKTVASAAEAKSMSIGCLTCEYTAEVLELIAGNEKELHVAKQALQTMCIVLPPSARCDVLSSKFDNLVQLVGQGKSPSQACSALSLCDAAAVDERKRFGAVIAIQ